MTPYNMESHHMAQFQHRIHNTTQHLNKLCRGYPDFAQSWCGGPILQMNVCQHRGIKHGYMYKVTPRISNGPPLCASCFWFQIQLQVKSSQNIYLFSVKTTLSCKNLFWVGWDRKITLSHQTHGGRFFTVFTGDCRPKIICIMLQARQTSTMGVFDLCYMPTSWTRIPWPSNPVLCIIGVSTLWSQKKMGHLLAVHTFPWCSALQ